MGSREVAGNPSEALREAPRGSQRVFVIDLEADGLLEDATRVHCASFIEVPKESQEKNEPRACILTDIHDILYLLSTGELKESTKESTACKYSNKLTDSRFISLPIKLVGHNIIGYDLPLLKKLYGFQFEGEVVDTLVLSRLLYVDRRKSHSLESWGETLGIKKPEHNDWSTISEEMIHRNQEDVRINYRLYRMFKDKLGDII